MKSWVLACFVLTSASTAVAETTPLWEIGQPDHNTAKFALGPSSYRSYRQPGFFVVGQSDAKKDWPYVQPGTVDGGWAPGAPQTFEILFALEKAPQGACELQLQFADTHSRTPPKIRVEINGFGREYQLPRGGGDASVYGEPLKGRPYQIRFATPAEKLLPGLNHISITTLSGSWLLWDSVRFLAPSNAKLGTAMPNWIVAGGGRKNVLEWHDGKLAQPVSARVYHAGPPTTATLHIADRATTIALKTGIQPIEAFVPPVDKKTVVPIALSIGSKTVAEADVELSPIRKWTVYILMHSHNDIGYTDIQPNIAKKQAHNVINALELIRKTKDYPQGVRFKWNLEVLMPYEDFHQIATPEQEAEFAQAVRDGNIGLDAMYANLLTGVCRSEELLRQFTFATALGRRNGVKVDSMMISDVPGLTWGVVPALVQNGVKYISDGPNYIDRIGYARVTWEDKPFYWLAPNGRDKVLYWAPFMGYAYGHTIDHVTDAAQRDMARLEKEDYPYDMVQMRWSKGDNGVADARVMDEVRQWNARYAWPKLVIATTSQMFHDFEERYGKQLPTFRGDFTPYWEDGTASSALETSMNRHSADRLLQAETLWAVKQKGAFPRDEFAAAWKNIALYSEHTWGAHNSIREPDLPFVKTQWKYKQAYALDADRQSRALFDKALDVRGADSRRNSTSEPPQGGTTNNAVDVYNTHSWPRTDLVTLSAALSPQGSASGMVTNDRDEAVPSQRLASGELVFLASRVPAFAASRYRIKNGSSAATGHARASGTTLSNELLTLKVDPHSGAIVSLRRRGIDVELVDGQVNGYLYLLGRNAQDARPNGPAKVAIEEAGPLVASLVVESDAPGCHSLRREIRLVDGLDRVEIIDTVDKLPIRTPEGVHFAFQFNVPQARVRVNSPWAVVEPEKDQLPGACKNWFSVERWVDVANAHYGVTWSTANAPLVEMGGLTANLPREQPDPHAYLATIAASPRLYSWAMNNHWETNSRAEQEGLTTFHYAVRPHGDYNAMEAAHFGVESTVPLVAAAAVGEKPPTAPLQIEPADVIATALKPSNDGKALIVRLFGASGKDSIAKIAWSNPLPKSVWLSDASEQPCAVAPETIVVPAWSIVTLRAEMR